MDSKLKAGDRFRYVGKYLPHQLGRGGVVTGIGDLYPDDLRVVFDDGEERVLEKGSAAPEEGPDSKDTNPKDAIGSTKLSFGLVPDTLSTFAALAFTEGATKYGSYNWRVAGVRASIYRDALERHLKKWWNGEEVDPKTGVSHLASVIACAGIILDAALVGKLTDDRPPKAPMGELIDSMEAKVAHLKELHKDKNPKHQTALGQQ